MDSFNFDYDYGLIWLGHVVVLGYGVLVLKLLQKYFPTPVSSFFRVTLTPLSDDYI